MTTHRNLAPALLGFVWGVAGAQAYATQPVTLNIEAQSVRAALLQFGEQAGLQVLMRLDGDEDNLTIAPVKGEFTARQALDRLLATTGLEYEFVNELTVRVVRREQAEQPSSAADEASGSGNPAAGAGSDQESANKRTSTDNAPDALGASESLEEIVVTAQKRVERLQDVPISISVLSGSDLDRASVAGVTEALNRIPGVVATAANQGGGTQVAIRGVGASGPLFNGSSPIAYYLDSVPFGLVASAIVPDPNPYDLERIEALRGPQGTLYGATAQNGALRILTHDADLEELQFKARALLSNTEGGSENYRADAALNVPIIPGSLAARAVVGHQELSGWIDSSLQKDINDAQLRNYRLKINGQPTDQLSVAVSAWSSASDWGGRSASDDHRRTSAVTPEAISTEYDLYGVKLGYDFSQATLTSSTGYLKYQNRSTQDLANALNLPLPPLFTGLDAQAFSEELLITSRRSGPLSWSVGGFYRDAEDRLRQNDLGGGIPFDYSRSSRSYAAFGELRHRFLDDRLEWTLGVRYFRDDVSLEENVNRGGPGTAPVDVSDTFTSTTPRAVLTWYPNRDLTVYASYAEGFRSGLHQDPAVARNNPELGPARPDKLRNYEIGAKGNALDGVISFEGALYFMDWREVQQTISVATGGTFVTAVINSESASGVGVDLSAILRPTDRLELGVSGSWNDLTLDDEVVSGGTPLFAAGDRLNLSSRATAGAFIDYSFPFGASGFKGELSTSANYISEQTNRGIFIGPFLTNGEDILVARASAALISPAGWTAVLFADNISDEYGAMPAVLPVPEWSPRVRPRTVGLQVEVQF